MGFCCCCCSVTKSHPALCDPVNCSMPGFPVLLYLLEFAKIHIRCVGDTIQPSHPLSCVIICSFSSSQTVVFFIFYYYFRGSSREPSACPDIFVQCGNFSKAQIPRSGISRLQGHGHDKYQQTLLNRQLPQNAQIYISQQCELSTKSTPSFFLLFVTLMGK